MRRGCGVGRRRSWCRADPDGRCARGAAAAPGTRVASVAAEIAASPSFAFRESTIAALGARTPQVCRNPALDRVFAAVSAWSASCSSVAPEVTVEVSPRKGSQT
jgi:hypothetical protein